LEQVQIAPGQEVNFFSERFPTWTGWRATLVVDAAGNFKGLENSSKAISNELDLQLLLALRAKADVIVTTGKTARSENYRSSRFAPIAFITRDRGSLIDLPALNNPGQFENLFLNNADHAELNFSSISEELKSKGFSKFLFEGGPSTLRQLLESDQRVEVVLTVVDTNTQGEPKPMEIFHQVIGAEVPLALLDDFKSSQNRVTRWLKAPK